MKKTHLQQYSMEVTVGAFMFMVLLALGFFTIVLSRENIFSKNYIKDVVFEDVSGLIKGDKAYTHGVDVGRVKRMYVGDDGVHVELSLRDDLPLREGYRISVEPSSVLGGRYVAIDPGPKDAPLIPEGVQLVGKPPVDFIGEASEAVKAVRKSLEKGGVLANLETTMKNLSSVSDDLAQGRGTIGKLLKEEEVYNELKEVASNLKDLTAKLNQGEGTLGKLLNDNKVYDDVQKITSDLREVSDRLAQGKGTIGKLLSDDDTLYKDLSEAAASIKDITQTISKGEGTLGKLTKSDETYNELNQLLGEVRATVDDLRETTPVVSFSSIFFGAF